MWSRELHVLHNLIVWLACTTCRNIKNTHNNHVWKDNKQNYLIIAHPVFFTLQKSFTNENKKKRKSALQFSYYCNDSNKNEIITLVFPGDPNSRINIFEKEQLTPHRPTFTECWSNVKYSVPTLTRRWASVAISGIGSLEKIHHGLDREVIQMIQVLTLWPSVPHIFKFSFFISTKDTTF